MGQVTTKPRVFLSYCREDIEDARRLRDDLIARGFVVWWDQDLLPGQDWKYEVRQAMARSSAVLLCLSAQCLAREESYIWPEALDAIAAYRRRRPGESFLVPVCLSECTIPPVEIDDTRTLDRLQRVDLFPAGRREEGVRRIVESIVKGSQNAEPIIRQANRNRNAMIQMVRTIWIRGFLEKSLFNEVRIFLGLAERPSAVASPFHLLVKRPDEGDRPLPPGTRVLDVYDDSDESLLILGEPGSGKTTLLLQLAQDLLDRADRGPNHPIPEVFPLSTWAASRKPLAEWLVDELNLRYDVPSTLGCLA